MPDQDSPLTFDQLPQWVREDFEAAAKMLGPDLIFRNPREVDNGWAASICTLDGEEGGDYVVWNEAGRTSRWTRSPAPAKGGRDVLTRA